jgi:hypothetical protein
LLLSSGRHCVDSLLLLLPPLLMLMLMLTLTLMLMLMLMLMLVVVLLLPPTPLRAAAGPLPQLAVRHGGGLPAEQERCVSLGGQ